MHEISYLSMNLGLYRLSKTQINLNVGGGIYAITGHEMHDTNMTLLRLETLGVERYVSDCVYNT